MHMQNTGKEEEKEWREEIPYTNYKILKNTSIEHGSKAFFVINMQQIQ